MKALIQRIRLTLHPYFWTRLHSGLLRLTLVAWAITSSVYALRTRPAVILIGTDSYGTRIIESSGDPLVAQERVKLIKDFLFRFYNYDAATYERRMEQAGGLMNDLLYREKEAGFRQTIAIMKTHPLRQDARLVDLREVDEREFEVDLAIRIVDRLVTKDVKYRVGLTIAPRKRDGEHPYGWEVVSYHEDELR